MMEAFGIYLLKCSGILLLFWATYHLFLKQETLFKENRWFLFSGILVSFLFPLYKLKKIVTLDVAQALNTPEVLDSHSYTTTDSAVGINEIVFYIYLAGCLYFLLRFLWHLKHIDKLARASETWREDNLRHVRTKKPIAPFSFFKSLFYNPTQFQDDELQLIRSHEKVHAREWHSLDVILGELLKIILWFNPLVWFYHKSIKQNLEFLADARAISNCNRTSYQFLMVRQATGKQLELSNSFYNSLIKKRIVMLNKNQSKRLSILKVLVVIPLMAVFLVAFNTENVYQFQKSDTVATAATDKTVELKIDKNTTDKALLKMKKDLADDAIDFSYTTVRNDAREIIDISIQISGKNDKGETFSGTYASNSEGPIDPLTVFYEAEANLLSIGNATKRHIKISKDGDHTMLWKGMEEIGEHEDIVIVERDGTKKIVVNNKEMNQDSLQSKGFNVVMVESEKDAHAQIHILSEDGEILEEKILGPMNGESDGNTIRLHIETDSDNESKNKIKRKKRKSKNQKKIMVIRDSDDDNEIEAIDSGEGFFFMDTAGNEPLYIIDGKEATKKQVKKLSPKKIATVNVLKGESASLKYGVKAKNGVVEIITKKKN